MPAPISGSASFQPVKMMMVAAASTPSEPSMSPSTSKYAPFTLRLSFEPAASSFMLIRLTTRPAAATASIGTPRISGGFR